MKGEYNPFPQDEAAWHDNPCPPVYEKAGELFPLSEETSKENPFGLSMFPMPATEE